MNCKILPEDSKRDGFEAANRVATWSDPMARGAGIVLSRISPAQATCAIEHMLWRHFLAIQRVFTIQTDTTVLVATPITIVDEPHPINTVPLILFQPSINLKWAASAETSQSNCSR